MALMCAPPLGFTDSLTHHIISSIRGAAHPPHTHTLFELYSPECVKEEFCALPLYAVLRSSLYQVRARLLRVPSTRRATMLLSSLLQRSF